VIPGDELCFRLRQVEWKAVRLRESGDREHDEADEHRKDVPCRKLDRIEEHEVAGLVVHDVDEPKGSGRHQCDDCRECERQLIGNHLS
jgi:hypothetical protein